VHSWKIIGADGYFTFGNIPSWHGIQGYFTFGNITTYRTFAQGYFNFGNITSAYRTFDDGYFTFSNTPSWHGADGYFTFLNSVNFTNITQGYFTFSNVPAWTNLNQGYFNFGNISAWKNMEQGYFSFKNVSAWGTILQGWFSFQMPYTPHIPGGGGTTSIVGTLELTLRGENANITIYQDGKILYSKSNLAKDTVHSWFKLPIGTYKIRVVGVKTGDVVEKDVTITENGTTNVEINIGTGMSVLWLLLIGVMGMVVCVVYISILFKKSKRKKKQE
jgi:hypothetical protein